MERKPTSTIEDYLTVIYVLERDGEEIIAARLAELIDVSPPTVTVTLKRMERDGWITSQGGEKRGGQKNASARSGIQLTEAGQEAARSVIRRHMLTEWMLSRLLSVPWSRVHSEAHHIEHTISNVVESSLRENLDDPQLCPHGNPFPGYEHVAAAWKPLSLVPAGTVVVIRRIHELAEDNPELMDFLEANGVFPGVQAEVQEVLPFNQTITLKMEHDRLLTLGFASARYLFVEITIPAVKEI